jgi:hypothetical protein
MTSYYVESLTVFTISAHLSVQPLSRKLVAAVALALACWLFGTLPTAQAQGKKTTPFIVDSFERATDLADKADRAGYGLAAGISVMGCWLDEGKDIFFTRQLIGGLTYRFIASGDRDAQDVDIEVRDANGKSVASDFRLDRDGDLIFTPTVTANYSIRMVLTRSRNRLPCVCTAVVMEKNAPRVDLKHLDTAMGKIVRGLEEADQIAQRNGRNADLRKADNQWAFFGGMLKPGQDFMINNLNLGMGEIIAYAAGDFNTRDVDLFAYDRDNREVASDSKTAADAAVGFRGGNGPYRLKMLNFAGNGESFILMSIFDIF